MDELQKCLGSCPSSEQEVSTPSKANGVVSVLNLMIDDSGNIFRNEVGCTMGGGDLLSPVAGIQEENKDYGDCDLCGFGVWWVKAKKWFTSGTSPAYVKVVDSYGPPSTSLKSSAVSCYSAYTYRQGQRCYLGFR